MLVEHPEDWKEITEKIEEEERKKKKIRKLIIIPSIIVGGVGLILFFSIGLPNIIASVSRSAAENARNENYSFKLLIETTGGELVRTEVGSYWAWSGVVENVGKKEAYCTVNIYAYGINQEQTGSFSYKTGLVCSGGKASYAIAQEAFDGWVASYSIYLSASQE